MSLITTKEFYIYFVWYIQILRIGKAGDWLQYAHQRLKEMVLSALKGPYAFLLLLFSFFSLHFICIYQGVCVRGSLDLVWWWLIITDSLEQILYYLLENWVHVMGFGSANCWLFFSGRCHYSQTLVTCWVKLDTSHVTLYQIEEKKGRKRLECNGNGWYLGIFPVGTIDHQSILLLEIIYSTII